MIDLFETTPVHDAVHAGDLVAPRRLLCEDPTVAMAWGWRGATPLHAAAKDGSRPPCCGYCWTPAPTPRARDDNGGTPLHAAATGEIAELLIDASADVDATDDHGRMPLRAAAWGGMGGNAELVALLLWLDGAGRAAATSTSCWRWRAGPRAGRRGDRKPPGPRVPWHGQGSRALACGGR